LKISKTEEKIAEMVVAALSEMGFPASSTAEMSAVSSFDAKAKARLCGKRRRELGASPTGPDEMVLAKVHCVAITYRA